MLQNGAKRLDVWKELVDKNDLTAFNALCHDRNLPLMDAREFASKAATLVSAQQAYPGLAIEDAYLMFVRENARPPQQSDIAKAAGMPDVVTDMHANGSTILIVGDEIDKLPPEIRQQIAAAQNGAFATGNCKPCGGGRER